MSLFFIFNNVHLAVSLIGALVFFLMTWLSFDTFTIRPNVKMFLRGSGFALLAIAQIISAFNAEGLASDLGPLSISVQSLFAAGLFVAMISYLLEVKSLASTAMFAGAAVSLVEVDFYLDLLNLGLSLVVAIFIFLQFRAEKNRSLLSICAGFTSLAVSRGVLVLIYSGYDAPWFLGLHLFIELVAFGLFFYWVWQYLTLRVHEEMMLIFAGMALLVATVVTVAFSSILVTQVSNNALTNLTTSVKVMDLAITNRQAEALAKVRLLANDDQLPDLIAERQIGDIDSIISTDLVAEELDFLVVLDELGEVVKSVPTSSQAGINLRQTVFGSRSLLGESLVTIDGIQGKPWAIVASAPIMADDEVAGVLVGGFLLDNGFVDNLEKITGLESSIYRDVERVATTEVGPDGVTRLNNIIEVNEDVVKQVLENDTGVALYTTINSEPYLASYLPIYDVDGRAVGMISATQSGYDVAQLATKTNQLTFIIVVILMIFIMIPSYFVFKRIAS